MEFSDSAELQATPIRYTSVQCIHTIVYCCMCLLTSFVLVNMQKKKKSVLFFATTGHVEGTQAGTTQVHAQLEVLLVDGYWRWPPDAP